MESTSQLSTRLPVAFMPHPGITAQTGTEVSLADVVDLWREAK